MIFKQKFRAKKLLSQPSADVNHIQINQELRKRLQCEILSIYNDVKAVCHKHGLSLFLCGGSALGAVRHYGFIPWDDDMDVAMTREDYKTFELLFENELSDRYLLKAPGYKDGSRSRFPKIMKKGTIFREIGNNAPEEECGIFLDIFILENVPDNMFIRTAKGIACNVLEFISGQVLLHEEKADTVLTVYKNANRIQYYIRKTTGIVFAFKSVKYWNRLIDRIIQYNKNTDYCSLPTGRKHYFGETLPRNVFLPGTKGVFEGETVLLFSDPDKYLKNLYGDYMVIPDKTNQEQHILEELKFQGE